jgi:hypothetical protein
MVDMNDRLYRVYLDLRAQLDEACAKELDQRVLASSPYDLSGVVFSMCLTLPEPMASELANRVIEIKRDEPVWNTYGDTRKRGSNHE